MKHTILAVGLSLLCSPLFSQVKKETDHAAKYAAVITGDSLKKHLGIIASAEMEGRETGTEGQRKAAAYIQEQFEKLKLKPAKSLGGYQQYYPLYEDSVDVTSCHLTIKDKVLEHGVNYFTVVTANSNKTIAADEYVFAGYGISEANYDDYTNLDVKGKVVVFFLGEPKSNGLYLISGSTQYSKYTYPGLLYKLKTAAEKGAAAAIVLNPSMANIPSSVIAPNSKSKLYYPEKDKEPINYAVVAHAYFKNLFPEWQSDSLVRQAKMQMPFHAATYAPVKAPFRFEYRKERQVVNASNVLGYIEGSSKKDEYVFLTAHYDHLGKKGDKIYYGADDDGSGTCALLNMAEAFAQAKAEGKGPKRTIVFLAFSGEEKGLWGSEYYSGHPVFPLDKTTVDLNTDMVGRVDTERKSADSLNYVYVIGHDKLSSDLQPINEGINKKYTKLTLDYKFDDPNDPEKIYYRSDHYNFAKKGVPVLFFYDGMLKADYHKPTDTIDKIYWNLYEKRVRMIFHTAWEMANRDNMLKRDKPLPEEEE